MTKSINFDKKSSWFADNWLLVLLLLFIAGIIGYTIYFRMTREKVPDTPIFALTPEVTSKRLVTSQRLLEANNKTVHLTTGNQAHSDLKQVWQQSADKASQNTVMLLSISKSQEPELDNILAWIEKGGHLITFSQAVRMPQESDDDSKQHYEFKENPLLVKLGVETRAFDKYDEKYRREPTETDSKSENNVDIDGLALMRLPTTKGDVLTLVSANDYKRLDSTQLFEKFPNVKAVADYTFVKNFNDEKPLDNEQLQFANVINPLTEPQYVQLKEAIRRRPAYHLPIDKVMVDVHFGKGRITILNDQKIFADPTLNYLERRYIDYCDQKTTQNVICQLEQQQGMEQLEMPSIPAKTTWEWLSYESRFYFPNVAEVDNALLLNYLTQQRQQVWLVPNIEVSSLFDLLWRYMKWACVAFLLFLAMAMLALPKRFGVVRPYQTDNQQNIFGYFNQIGEYLWQNDQAFSLVNQNRQRLLEKIMARHPTLSGQTPVGQLADPSLLCQVVAKEMGMLPEQVAQALHDDWQNDNEFLQVSRQFALINRYYSMNI